jgi:hypothetical protein
MGSRKGWQRLFLSGNMVRLVEEPAGGWKGWGREGRDGKDQDAC